SCGRRDRYFAFVYRYRRPIVMAALMCSDLAATLIAISCTHWLLRMTGLRSPAPRHLTASLVVLAFLAAGLYTGSGPGPYGRFRLRTIGIAGFVAISTIAMLPEQKVVEFLFAQLANAACLLLIGHYIEATSRGLLIHLDLWGASTVLVGTVDDCRELAHVLA